MTRYEDTAERHFADIDRRLRALETAPRAPFTSIPDDAGNEVVRLSREGLTIVDGAIYVGGGPVRALDLAYWEGDSHNETVTSPPSKLGVATITPPSWATTVVAQCLVLFQMSNNTGSDLVMEFRATVNGVPSSGVYSASVPVGAVVNVTDYFQATLERDVDFTTSFECAGYLGVQSGSNDENFVRSKVSTYYMR